MYKVSVKNNKIYFENNISLGTITINFDGTSEISLVKVKHEYRGKGYGKQLFHYMMRYLKENHPHISKIILSPLPVAILEGLNLEQLIKFYSKFHFKRTINPPSHAPYMMEYMWI